MSGSPFDKLAELKPLLPQGRHRCARRMKPAPSPEPPSPARVPLLPKPPPTDEELFLRVMEGEGVAPLPDDEGPRLPLPPSPDKFSLPEALDDDAMVLKRLSELVAGAGDFDLSFTDEYLEGHVKSLPPFVLRNLREGRYPIQAHLDLHGCTLAEAQAELGQAIPRYTAMGYRAILVIHGRGRRSPDGIPVLKLNLGNLLLRTSIRKYILAFVTARPFDGGSGACYVLLRKRARTPGRR
ncbi:MAG: Smr/MutS family protein [Deltaproteobacteria bacterium]|jgi:DNA-nicking Smr family endonuclease|nr:Smr/MutS family protein [Deltaproteobacteria bacterium]